MPAAAASALRPMATRMPLMAMTAVQALCRMAKRIPDQPNSWRRERSESAESRGTSWCAEFSALAIFSGTEIKCSEVQNSRPMCSGYLRLRRDVHRAHWFVLLGSREQSQNLRLDRFGAF